MECSDEQQVALDTDEEKEKLKELAERFTNNIPGFAETLSGKERNWLLTQICLQIEIVPELRKFVGPIIEKRYEYLKREKGIDTQVFPNVLKEDELGIFRTCLQYVNINNNCNHGLQKENFNYKVTNKVDFSKLCFLKKDLNLINYTDFDETCDASALLHLIINIVQFRVESPDLFHLATRVREIRNTVAHFNKDEWTDERFDKDFEQFEHLIDKLQLPYREQSYIKFRLMNIYLRGKESLQRGTEDKAIMTYIAEKVEVLYNLVKTRHTTEEKMFKCEEAVIPTSVSEESNYQQLTLFIKIYAFLKEEMTITYAYSIACRLFESDCAEGIAVGGPRRRGVGKLLKRVLKDHPLYLTRFMDLLTQHQEISLTSKIKEAMPEGNEIEEVKCKTEALNSTGGIQEANAKLCWTLLENDVDALVYQIKGIDTIDRLNDYFLSTLFFSIKDHDTICDEISETLGDECKEGARCLIKLMQMRSETIMEKFCLVMESFNKGYIVTNLKLRQKYCGLGNVDEISQASSPGNQVDPTEPKDLFSEFAGNIRTLDTHMKNSFTFKVHDASCGSIIVRLYPESEQSWAILKEKCLAREIDGIFEAAFSDDAFSFVTGVKYKLLFTIYSVVDHAHKDKAGQRMAVFKFDFITGDHAQREAEDVLSKKSHIEQSHDVLCEELEICDALIDDLRKAGLVEEDINDKIERERLRSSKIRCLLASISPSDEGYNVIKEHLRTANMYLWQRLEKLEDEEIHGEHINADIPEDVLSKKSHIEQSHDVLCEELEICDALIDDLRKAGLVEEDIKDKIERESLRSSKIRCLLANISPSDKGYKVIKEHLRTTNMYLCQRLEKLEEEVIHGELFFQCEAHINADIPDVSRIHDDSVLPKTFWVITNSVFHFLTEDQIKPPGVSDIKATSCCLSCSLPEGVSCSRDLFVEQLRVDSEFGWVRLNASPIKTTVYKADGLIPGKRYKFRIVIEVGKAMEVQGQETQEVEAIEYPGQPSKPDNYDVTNTSCSLEWRPPSFDGGSSIKRYEIYKETCYTSNWECCGQTKGGNCLIQINGLTSLQRYRFKVRAANKVGVGCWSTESDSVYTTGIDLTDVKSLAVMRISLLEEQGMESISNSFERGFGCVIELLESLQPLTTTVTYNDINLIAGTLRFHAEKLYKHMKNASGKVESLNFKVNRRMEEVINQQAEKEQLQSEKDKASAYLMKKINSLKSDLEYLRQEKETAEKDNRTALDELRTAEEELQRKKGHKDIANGIAIGGLFVPIFGWVVSAVSYAAANTILEQNIEATDKCVKNQSESQDHHKKRVDAKADNIKKHNSEFSQLKKEEDTLKKEVGELKQLQMSLQQQLNQLADLSVQMRQCTTFVAGAAARAEVLEDQIKFLYDISFVMDSLRDLAKHFQLMEASSGMGRILERMDMNIVVNKLELIAASNECLEPLKLLDHQKDLRVVPAIKYGKEGTKTMTQIYGLSSRLTLNMDEDRKIIMSQHADCAGYLGSAPKTVELLGHLILISFKHDFPLDGKKPVGGFKYLQRPKSFRASVVQMANAGWKAYDIANRNMDQIKMYSNTIPELLTKALEMLKLGSNEEIGSLLSQPLSLIRQTSKKCLQLAKNIQLEFHEVIKLTAELQETCVSIQSDNKKKRWKAEADLTELKIEQDTIDKESKLYEEELKKKYKSLSDAENKHTRALTSLPSTKKMLVMAAAEKLSVGLTKTLDIVSAPFKSGQSAKDEDQGECIDTDIEYETNENKRAEENTVIPDYTQFDETDVTTVQKKMLPLKEKLEHFVKKFVNNELEDPTLKSVSELKSIIQYQAGFDKIQKNIGALNQTNTMKDQAEELCTRCISVCEALTKMSEEMSDEPNEKIDLAKSISKLSVDIHKFLTGTKTRLKAIQTKKKLAKKPSMSHSTESGAVRMELEKVQFQIESTYEQLKRAMEEHDNTLENVRRETEALANLLSETEKLDLETMDLEAIVNLLNKCLKQFGNLKQEWGKMVHIFQTITSIIDISLKDSLNYFVDAATAAKSRDPQSSRPSSLKREMLYQWVFKASEIAYFVKHLTESYTMVSENCFLPVMKSLPKLLKCTNATDVESKLQELEHECDKAQCRINEHLNMKKEEFCSAANVRIATLQSVIENEIPQIEQDVKAQELDDFT